MENDKSHIDPDLELSRHIDRRNLGVESESQDDLLSQLDAYKSQRPSAEGRDEVWNHVQTAISKDKTVSRFRLLSSSKYMAVAATFLVAAVASWFWISSSTSQEIEYLAQVGQGSEVIVLDDGSKITLRQNTSLVKVGDGRYRLDGEAYFEIVHRPERSFVVEAHGGTIEVLGTVFNADTRSGRLRTYLKEGRIRLSSAENAIELTPGKSAFVENSEAQFELSSEERLFLDWQSNYLEMSQTNAKEAIDELAQHFDVNIILPSNLDGETISGSLSLVNLQTSLNDLSLVLNGTFEKQDDSTYTFIAN